MSFLPGRLAATEGAYFLQESKQAVGRLAQTIPTTKGIPPPKLIPSEDGAADMLPEILRHSIPVKGIPPESDPSLSTSSKWLLPKSSSGPVRVSRDALNPISAFVSLPQATFGPRRWKLPDEHPAFSASTANELRTDREPTIDSKKLQALAIGYTQIGKAFAIATTIVFGGSAAAFAYTAHKLQMKSADDIRTKGRDVIQPRADMVKEQIIPLRTWAENMSKKWHYEGGGEGKEKSVVKELAKTFGR